MDFESLVSRGQLKNDIVKTLRDRTGWYDPAVFGALEAIAREETAYSRASVTLSDLRVGMILDEGLYLESGMMLVGKGQEITETLRLRVQVLSELRKIRQPIVVLINADL